MMLQELKTETEGNKHHETRTQTKEPAKTTGSTPSEYQSKGHIF
jgi:hypothetical protein